MDRDTAIGGPRGGFPTTSATVVEALRADGWEQRRDAAERLIAIYWKPLYKYARIRWRRSNEDAKDLIQGFFATALERETLAAFDPTKAGLRTFLRLLLDRYAANELKAARRLKRGGGVPPLDFEEAEAELARVTRRRDDPEELLRHEWVRSLFGAAVERLRDELRDSGHARRFRVFAAFELADDKVRPTYRDLGASLGIPETTITNELAAARRRFRAIVLETLRTITVSEEEFRSEARAVLGVEP
jgi:RNA polymerase sigma factor (sigma-70 family)